MSSTDDGNDCVLGVLAILTSASEFNPQMSQVVKARPSDDLELSEVHVQCCVP